MVTSPKRARRQTRKGKRQCGRVGCRQTDSQATLLRAVIDGQGVFRLGLGVGKAGRGLTCIGSPDVSMQQLKADLRGRCGARSRLGMSQRCTNLPPSQTARSRARGPLR